MDGYVDLDLLSISLKDRQESWEGMRGRQAFPNGNNGGERGEKLAQVFTLQMGKKAL